MLPIIKPVCIYQNTFLSIINMGITVGEVLVYTSERVRRTQMWAV